VRNGRYTVWKKCDVSILTLSALRQVKGIQMTAVVERVDRLEELMAQLLQETARTSREMREFKTEMRAFKDEMRLSAQRSEQEMREFKAEMHGFKDEMRRDTQELRKQIGESFNKAGRLVEDAIAPGMSKIFQTITGLGRDAIERQAIRVEVKQPHRREFDAVIAGGDYVLINETKSTLRPDDVKKFQRLMEQGIRQYFPEYSDKKFIGVVSSLYIDDSIIALGSKLGLYVLGFGEDLMDVLNPQDFTPHYF